MQDFGAFVEGDGISHEGYGGPHSAEPRDRAEAGSLEADLEIDDFDLLDDSEPERPRKRVPYGDVFEAARAGDLERLRHLVDDEGVDVNARDRWDAVPLYYACLAGHSDVARVLLDAGAICSERTFDGDRCHYAALTLRIRKLLKRYKAKPPPLAPLAHDLGACFSGGGGGDATWWPDFTFFFVAGRPLRVHRFVLAARSPYFGAAFAAKWRGRAAVRLANPRLTHAAFHALLRFFYTDRLDVAVEEMPSLLRICKVCQCHMLGEAVGRELERQKYSHWKTAAALSADVGAQRRFILQGTSLPPKDRLPAAMELALRRLQQAEHGRGDAGHGACVPDADVDADVAVGGGGGGAAGGEPAPPLSWRADRPGGSSAAAAGGQGPDGREGGAGGGLVGDAAAARDAESAADGADLVCIVGGRRFRCHRAMLAARSEYFRALIGRTGGFLEGSGGGGGQVADSGAPPPLRELAISDLTAEAFEKLLEFIYTDNISSLESHQAEEVVEAAARYLLFPLKRAVATALIPSLAAATPGEICYWLQFADLYGVWKLREYCLDEMAADFESFAAAREFRDMLRRMPQPSRDSELRTSAPSAPGAEGILNGLDQSNVLDDLREKWLELDGAELEARDASAAQFDLRLEALANWPDDCDSEEGGGDAEGAEGSLEGES